MDYTIEQGLIKKSIGYLGYSLANKIGNYSRPSGLEEPFLKDVARDLFAMLEFFNIQDPRMYRIIREIRN